MRRLSSSLRCLAMLGLAALTLQAGSIIVLINQGGGATTGSVDYDGGLTSPMVGTNLAAPFITGDLGNGPCVDCTFEFTSGPFLGGLPVGFTGWRFGAVNSSFELKSGTGDVLMAGRFLPQLTAFGPDTAAVVDVLSCDPVGAPCFALIGAAGTVTDLAPSMAGFTSMGPGNQGIGFFFQFDGVSLFTNLDVGTGFHSLDNPSGFAGFATPEPSAFLLSSAGLLGLALTRLRRRR